MRNKTKIKKVHEHIQDTSGLPKKDLFRVDEVAKYFDVTERTIFLWIAKGNLAAEKIVGTLRIPRTSILNCRFGKNNAN